MNGMEMLITTVWLTIGIVVLIVAITVVVSLLSKKKDPSDERIFVGKLANTDASIKEAVKNLKLTNSLVEKD